MHTCLRSAKAPPGDDSVSGVRGVPAAGKPTSCCCCGVAGEKLKGSPKLKLPLALPPETGLLLVKILRRDGFPPESAVFTSEAGGKRSGDSFSRNCSVSSG